MNELNESIPESLALHIPSVTVNGETWRPDASIYLGEIAVAACRAGNQPPESALPLAQVDQLLNVGYLTMETGWARMSDGQLYVAALTPMPNVTGEMIDWWFAWHATGNAYLLWHPRDHIEARWKNAPNRSLPWKQQYIGNTSEIIEYVGSNKEYLNVWFKPPETYFDVSRFESADIATAICSRGGQRRENIWTAHVIHLVRNTERGVEMRSRFWLGDLDASPKGLVGKLLTPFMNSPAARRRNIPDELGRALMLHCAEEMHHLAGILPELYKRFGPGATSQ